MADHSRLEDLRRRIQKDPASIAFAQLAEEYRRVGQFQESVDACRAGLTIHPGYLSARVTLGRSLVELQRLDDAQREFEVVLKSASENLAAIRGLAEIFHRRGALTDALTQYQAALALARNDPDLNQIVDELTRQLAPPTRPEPASPPPIPSSFDDLPEPSAIAAFDEGFASLMSHEDAGTPVTIEGIGNPAALEPTPDLVPAHVIRAQRTIEALEQWLDAVHAARTVRDA